MIQLRPDCLIFKTNDGDQIPCSAEWVSLELMGDNAFDIDPEVIRNAAAAVLHYFKYELDQEFVSVGEFAEALATALRGLGVDVSACATTTSPPPPPAGRVADSDLRKLAVEAGKGYELFFFPNLRDEIKRQLECSPKVLRFHGLRTCVKQLAGAHRWNRRCQSLTDQIVEFLRTCWSSEMASQSCALVVY